MISPELQQAIDNLHIQDVYLRWSQSLCTEGFRPQDHDFSSFQMQQMHALKQAEVFEVDGGGRLLRVFTLFGVRWVTPNSEGSEPEVKAVIEAEFVAEYQQNDELPQTGIDEFVQKNVNFHVWPYWREFVSSQSERLRLPKVTLPTIQLAHHKMQPQEPVQ